MHKEDRIVEFQITDHSTYRGMKNLYRPKPIIAPIIDYNLKT